MKEKMKKLGDTSLMPWGLHKGKAMQDVPASYLHYFWAHKGLKDDKQDLVADYIRRHLVALKDEYPDGIWT
jgi:uncharacterized protein (DUF3820 family)